METSVVANSSKEINKQLEKTKQASRQLIACTAEDIAALLYDLADLTLARQQELLAANRKDLERMDENDPLYDRLLLNEKRLQDIASDLRKVADLPSPLHQVLEERKLPNDLQLKRLSVPLGVVGIVFESRPNVTFDVFALCLKSGNATALKGSRHAHFSNVAIVELIHEVLAKYDLPKNICYLLPSEREALSVVLNAISSVDVIIPRGGRGLIDFVRNNSKVPVIETGAGIVHTYFDESGDVEKGKAIIENAKARRVSVCNALDTLIIHEKRLANLPELVHELGKKHQCEIVADTKAYDKLKQHYPSTLLQLATEADFGTEFLAMKLSIKTVSNLEEALAHIATHSSQHSEAIIAEDEHTTDIFLKRVDAAVVYANTSTAFTDGSQFGLGAEIGISTQKLHARGPMALRELTSYKWVLRGDGQIRS